MKIPLPANWLIAIAHIGSVSIVGAAGWEIMGYVLGLPKSGWFDTPTPMALSTAVLWLIGGIIGLALTTAMHKTILEVRHHLTICHGEPK